jgi:hypothetical protein
MRKTQAELAAEQELLRLRRRRGIILKLIRGNHEYQGSRMDDFEVWSMMQKIVSGVGRDQVRTMLQDLEVLDYITFHSEHNVNSGELELSQIELTAAGLRFMTGRKSNDDVELM